MFGYLDGKTPCLSTTITKDSAIESNLANTHWIRQDQLILSAIISSLTPSLIPFIAAAEAARSAWEIITNTYGKSSRGKIIALKNKLHNLSKGSRSITDYMLEIKGIVDELSLLGVTIDPENLVLKVLNGLDNSYTSILFDELHEKTFEHLGSIIFSYLCCCHYTSNCSSHL